METSGWIVNRLLNPEKPQTTRVYRVVTMTTLPDQTVTHEAWSVLAPSPSTAYGLVLERMRTDPHAMGGVSVRVVRSYWMRPQPVWLHRREDARHWVQLVHRKPGPPPERRRKAPMAMPQDHGVTPEYMRRIARDLMDATRDLKEGE